MFDRLYFDTNILRTLQWPRLSSKLQSIFELARLFKIEVFLPDCVEAELEAHWLREWGKLHRNSTSSVSDLNKHLLGILPDRITLQLPETPQLLQNYREKVLEIKQQWGIKSVPITSNSVSKFFEMAISQHPPFKEKGSGFQDAVIYLSVIDHLRHSSGTVAAFASQDRAFEKQEVLELATSAGVEIEIYKTIDEVARVLEERLEKFVDLMWQKDRQLATTALTNMIPQIEQFLFNNLLFSIPQLQSIGWTTGKLNPIDRPVMVESIKVTSIKDVWTTPPWKRKSDEDVKVSFKTEVDISILVNRFSSHPASLLRIGEPDLPPASLLLEPIPETQIWQHLVEIEATAIIVEGEVKDVKFVSAGLKTIGLLDSVR